MKKTLFASGLLLALLSGCTKKENSENALDNSSLKADAVVAGSPVGDVVGKVTVGYQGWFTAPGDGSAVDRWTHQNLEMWPEMKEYTTSYQTPFPALPDGRPAKMFSSYDQSTVDVHFRWMQENGIDCAALQRFTGELSDPPFKSMRDGMAQKVRNAAEASGRKFYIMYDISGDADMQSRIKTDWTNTITGTLNLLSSPAYAKQNGKPVVCIFGMGYLGAKVPGAGDSAQCLDVISWFKSQGCYVIGSVPMDWRTPQGVFTRDNFMTVYESFDMLSPWAVAAQVGPTYQPWIKGDYDYCEAHGMDYQPIAYPGFSFHNTNAGSPLNEIPRNHGDFMWAQVAVMKQVGAKSLYVAMFDEVNEGTAIFKVAENASQAPANTSFVHLDQDGVAVSSDFYLRLVNDAGKMIKGQIPYQATHPTPHVIGGAGPLADGTYRIINRNSNLALDAKGQGTANETAIQQWGYSGGTNQQWTITSLGGDHYKIIGVQSGKSLDIKGQSLLDGATLQLYDYNAGANQDWIISPAAGGGYTIQGAQSGKVLEVPAFSTTAGIIIEQYGVNNGANQQWLISAP
ncbi:RICIN domain-containing protein [Chitinophaga pinensis]|uniref:Ricin B lectin n=1 Tax=Chitinophaga pinensis (strain ATCC 43595 / DSM 2588 / LMG 13176 / NBRC 15968 / NCIMB 11800 / UQM 2034) TaxID=485918 RepID=A0A979G7N6_CHIPD|nr:RICIN domain-containing protein [Chitinophaga pinensis]ACU62290.1 Ricin B lectin [Chitinophaga pinensis DSM 2588]